MSSQRTKVKIIREYLDNNDDTPEEITKSLSSTRISSRSRGNEDTGPVVSVSTTKQQQQQPMKINVVKERTRNQNNNQISNINADGSQASFGDMQEKMEMELEKRRKDWEKDVMKMQQEFFKMPAAALKATDDTGGNPIAIHTSHLPSSTGADILDISNTKDIFTTKPDGTRVYNLRFNVKGFSGHEISVKANGGKLTVTAKHEESQDSGQKSARNFNRQMDIPAGVEIDNLSAELSSDGILCIEAPVNEEEYEKGKPVITDINSLGKVGNFDETESYSVGDPFKAMREVVPGFTPHYKDEEEADGYGQGLSISSFEHAHGYPGHTCHIASRPKMKHMGHVNPPHVEQINEYARKLKLNVDVGSEYKPEDVNVQIDGGHIHVKAMHEETTPSGRKARREFKRTFECPEKIDKATMRAILGPNGRLVVGASLVSNKDHHSALESIKNDMPVGGKPVNIF